MTRLLHRVSRALGMETDTLEREALLCYLLNELRRVSLEAKMIMQKYGVSSIEELDEKVRRGDLEETEVLEDLTRLDYLLDREEKLRRLLKEL